MFFPMCLWCNIDLQLVWRLLLFAQSVNCRVPVTLIDVRKHTRFLHHANAEDPHRVRTCMCVCVCVDSRHPQCPQVNDTRCARTIRQHH